MRQPDRESNLTSAWRALDRRSAKAGWGIIEIFSTANCCVMAGRRGSSNEECVLVGVDGPIAMPKTQLPKGQGFSLIATDITGERPGYSWFALIRHEHGALELFTKVAIDLVVLVEKIATSHGQQVGSAIVSRILAWQAFMKRGREGLLSAEEEIGLVGELTVLSNLVFDGVPPITAIECWAGPEDGLHDFEIGTGAIEVKTTTNPSHFVARISCLDQLDDGVRRPLYIAAVRLAQTPTGTTLSELVDRMMREFSEEGAAALFTSKLVASGFVPSDAPDYTRRFRCAELTYRPVSTIAPRLTRSNVPAAVLDATYSLDLEAYPPDSDTYAGISNNFGVGAYGTN